MFTCDPISDVDARAMAEERKLFVRYLNSLEEPQLHDIEPLPYRRVLGEAEAATLRSQVAAAWGIAGGYWYPLDGVERQDVLAFQAPYFRRDLPGSTLHRLIGESGVSRVYELREYGPNYELDLGEMDPEYNGAEGYWCAESLDWIIYASHESSVTVGGQGLVAAIQQAWPAWDRFVWTSPFF
jgi:hypothetical protein